MIGREILAAQVGLSHVASSAADLFGPSGSSGRGLLAVNCSDNCRDCHPPGDVLCVTRTKADVLCVWTGSSVRACHRPNAWPHACWAAAGRRRAHRWSQQPLTLQQFWKM